MTSGSCAVSRCEIGAFRARSGDDGHLARFEFGVGPLLRIETQAGFALLLVGAVALVAGVGKDRPNVAAVVDPLGTGGRRCDKGRPLEPTRYARPNCWAGACRQCCLRGQRALRASRQARTRLVADRPRPTGMHGASIRRDRHARALVLEEFGASMRPAGRKRGEIATPGVRLSRTFIISDLVAVVHCRQGVARDPFAPIVPTGVTAGDADSDYAGPRIPHGRRIVHRSPHILRFAHVSFLTGLCHGVYPYRSVAVLRHARSPPLDTVKTLPHARSRTLSHSDGRGQGEGSSCDEKSSFLSVRCFKTRPHPGPLAEYPERELVNSLRDRHGRSC